MPYIGELRVFGGLFAPEGWALCDGSLQSISQNQPLYQLIGTTYGGDGSQTFALPDLRGRVVTHVGNGLNQGQTGGAEQVSLTTATMPSHNHVMNASAATATTPKPQSQLLATLAGGATAYGLRTPLHSFDPSAIAIEGGGGAHPNLQPYLCITWIISLYGVYPRPA